MNTERRTYSQAVAQTQAEKKEEKDTRKEKEKEVQGKGKGPSQTPPRSEQGAGLPQRFPFVKDMSEYEEEEERERRGRLSLSMGSLQTGELVGWHIVWKGLPGRWLK